MLTRLLSQKGYKVEQAENAEAALHILKHKEIDLILSDVVMAGLDGFELAQIVHDQFPHIKIQMMSGYFDQSSSSSPFLNDLKANILLKPFKTTQFLARITQLLS